MVGHFGQKSNKITVVYVAVWPACCPTAVGRRRLLFLVPCEKILQTLAGLRYRATDPVMGKGEGSRGTQ